MDTLTTCQCGPDGCGQECPAERRRLPWSTVDPEGTQVTYDWAGDEIIATEHGQTIADGLTWTDLAERLIDHAAAWAKAGGCPVCAWESPADPEPGNLLVHQIDWSRCRAECADCGLAVTDRTHGKGIDWYFPMGTPPELIFAVSGGPFDWPTP